MARRWLDRTLFQRIPPTGRPVTPLRRREWRSRAAAALCFAFYAGVGLTPVAAQMPPRMNEGAPAVVRDTSTQANSLAEKFSADLDAQVASKTDAILDQVSEQMSAQLLRRLEQNIATRLEPPTSTAKPMLSIVIRPDSEEEVSEPEGKPLELAEQPA